MRKFLKWFLTLGLLAAGAAAAAHFGQAWWRERNRPRYLTAAVSRGRVEAVVNSTGTIKPVRSVSVGAFVSGPLKEVYVDFNSVVKQGEVLALIDPRLLQTAVDRDRASLRTQVAEKNRIRALLDQAVRNETRALRLRRVNKDYISENELDQFKYTRLSTEAQLDLAKANIEQAKASLDTSETNLG